MLISLRSALKCLIYKRSITTTTRLCSSNNYNSFISRSISSKESNSSRQNASSSNRVQEQINHGNHSTYRHRHSPRIIRHHNGRREGNSQTQVNANGRDDSSNRFNLQKILDTGSESAQNALKSILSRIHHLQPLNQQVQYVSPTQGLITCSIQQVLEDLDLSTQGLQLIEREVTTTTTTNNNTKNADTSPSVIPLIKKIKIQEMLKAYNDELAEAKELELLTMGSKKTIKALDNKLRAKQKKSSEKQIMIKWSISLNDLTNQKQVEIDNRLKKEKSKIAIYLIHNKKSPNLKITDIFRNSNNSGSNESDVDEMMDIELKKRNKVKQTLEGILNSLECKWTMEGDVESKVVYSITPTVSTTTAVVNEKGKLGEVNQQLEKNKKKQKAKSAHDKQEKSKVDEEDLDALYLFKIED